MERVRFTILYFLLLNTCTQLKVNEYNELIIHTHIYKLEVLKDKKVLD